MSSITERKVYMLAFFRFDYSVHADRANRFYPEIRKYYPSLKDGSLEPGYAGIRPKLSGPKQGFVDFVIQVVSFSFCHCLTGPLYSVYQHHSKS